jgi:hypothetical protein
MSEALVDAVDDLPHPVGAEPDYSESFYYQFGDAAVGLNGFLRLSNRPNEGRGERTVCLYLPDGRVAFSFDRPVFADPGTFDAAGMRIVVEEPLVAHRVSFAGDVFVLSDPWAMSDPKRALRESPRERCSLELDVRATAPAQPFSLDELGDFTPNHYEQFVAAQGAIRIGDTELAVQAHGMRDRGWGPRSWQAPRFYRWLFGSSDGISFAAGLLGRGGSVRTGGFVWEQGAMRLLDDVAVKTDYQGEGVASLELTLAAGDRSWSIEGKALNAVPLRHRRAGTEETTRILETSVLWSSEGRQMLGIAEYLDQIVDGKPVGIAEHDLAAR